jgi:hypothetical protein
MLFGVLVLARASAFSLKLIRMVTYLGKRGVLGDDSEEGRRQVSLLTEKVKEKKTEISGQGVELKLEPGNLKTLEIKKYSSEDRSKKKEVEKNKEDLHKQLESVKELREKQVDFLKNQLEKQNDLQKKLKSNTVKELTERESEIEIEDGASISGRGRGFEIRDGRQSVQYQQWFAFWPW